MNNATIRETVYHGDEADSVFPIPFPFAESAEVSAELVDGNGGRLALLPGLEFIVNRVSDANGELILLEDNLKKGESLHIRVASAPEEPEAQIAPAPDGVERELASLRESLAALRLETIARIECLETQAARRTGGGLARKIWNLWEN